VQPFGDPVLRRELNAASRRWQTYLPRLVVGAFLVWITGYLWDRASGWGAAGYSQLADLARETFALVFVLQMVALPLLAASAASDLVTRELRHGTLGLLLLTPLTAWRIALGKWAAAVAQVLAILLLSAPLLAICVYLGGVAPGELLWAVVLPLAASAFAAALGLLMSSCVRTPSTAVVGAVLLLVLGIVAPAVAAFDSPKSGFEFLAAVHPAFAAFYVAERTLFRAGGPMEPYWLSSSVLAAGLSLLLLALTARRLPGRVHVTAGPTLFARLMGGLDRAFERVNVGGKSWFAAGGVWETRGLLWKELRLRAAGRLRYATRVGLVALLGLMLLASSFGGLQDAVVVFAWGLSILLALQALVSGVGLFISEKEGRQWDVLLSTPLSSADLIGAKLLAGLATLGPGLVIGALYATGTSLAANHPGLVWTSMAVPVGFFTAYTFLASAAASLRCATYRGAFALAMGLVLGVLVGIPLLVGVLETVVPGGGDFEWWIAATNPAWQLHRFGEEFWYGGPWYGYEEHLFEGATLGGVVFYGAACVVLRVWMSHAFARLAGRG
jgi:ABC-type transport system involved in multi-copper enzyme maturation permease subunit